MSLLETRGLTRRFDGVTAVDHVSMAVAEGSAVALVGPNGAGKTTLCAMLSGFCRPDSGSVHFAGHKLGRTSVHRRARLGLVRTSARAQPFARLSVCDNIAIGAHLHHGRRAAALARAREVATRLGLGDVCDVAASELPPPWQKRLDLARALATKPRLLLVDELFAGLDPGQVRELRPILRRIRDDGVTLLLIERELQTITALCDHVVVLASGSVVAQGEPLQLLRDAAVAEAYGGRGAFGSDIQQLIESVPDQDHGS